MTRKIPQLCLPFWITLYCHLATAQSDSLMQAAQKHRKQQEYASAFKCLYLNGVLLEKSNQKSQLAQNNIAIAEICNDWKIHLKAVEYYQKAQEIYQEIKPADLAQKNNFLNEKIAQSYQADQKYVQAIPYYEKVLNAQNDTASPAQKAKLLSNLANLYNLNNNYNKALEYNLQALALYEQQQDKQAQAITLNNIGFGYQKTNQTTQATIYLEKAKKLQEELNNTTSTEYRTILTNLAILYQSQNEFAKSKQYLMFAELSLSKDEKATLEERANIFNLMAKTYLYTGELNKVEPYTRKALATAEKSKYLEAQKDAYETLSSYYSLRNQNKAALEAYKQYSILSDSLFNRQIIYQRSLLERQKLSEETENELKLLQAEKDLKALDLANYQLKAEKTLQEFEIERQKHKISIADLEQTQLREQARTNSLLLEKQRQETQLQRQALELAIQGNKLKESELQKIKIEQQARENERKIREEALLKEKQLKEKELQAEREAKRLQQNLFLVIVAASIILITIFLWAYIQKQKSNKKLKIQKLLIEENNLLLEVQKSEILESNAELNAINEELRSAMDTIMAQKEQLEEKNRAILDSISYAQRIQNAILPTEEDLKKVFPASFALFLPRDVVSGDFFFLEQEMYKQVLAVIDCTGHGVPGAFMTLVASEILHELIFNQNILEAEEILYYLHKRIRSALKQAETDNRDGMDIALIIIDQINNLAEFAGAKSPLVYIQENELFFIKGDKMPIGGEQHEKERIFTKHTISIDKPTSFYLFSDGYQDQFGGKDNKKFGIAQMKELFLKNYSKPMNEQKLVLQETIVNWMKEGNENQIDDILVVGVKLG
ncbi:MAG: tetratricopeptide repeat protein [Microscillaceae bacterium]|nr:tetratricopeptide repeat protein [Microscillaceae bacterium]MDW8461322.1 tetratricopeptide repeat protein [Cytophagales bacterium]